jgi:hypothetical protein
MRGAANLTAADFSMPAIEILRRHDCSGDVSIEADDTLNNNLWRSPMQQENRSPMTPSYCQEDTKSPSRLQDEKISDDSGTETKTNSALAPAGLKNPFWSKAS